VLSCRIRWGEVVLDLRSRSERRVEAHSSVNVNRRREVGSVTLKAEVDIERTSPSLGKRASASGC
jgi:hypothetical protein